MVMTQERITTPCPACGCESLTVGDQGALVCSLISCPQPSAEIEVESLKGALDDARVLLLAIAAAKPYAGQRFVDTGKLVATTARVLRALRQPELVAAKEPS